MADRGSRSRRPGEKVLTRYPLSSTWISESLKSGLFSVDEEGNLRIIPTVLIDPTVNPCALVPPPSTSVLGAAINLLGTNLAQMNNALEYVYSPALGNFQAVRTPSHFITSNPAALGANIIWPAVAGVRHRILAMTIDFPGTFNAAAANVLCILQDAAAAVGINTNCYIPGAATFYNAHFEYDLRPNGIISAALNTDWNLSLSVAIANNPPRVNIIGTEE
jgi:hypothetical protein